jgi:AAA domain
MHTGNFTHPTSNALHTPSRTPSLSVTDGDDGKPLVHSFAGCDPCDVLAALRSRGLLDARRPNGGTKPNSTKAARPVRTFTYEYRDPASGEARYRKIRREYADGTKSYFMEPRDRGGSPPLLYGGERLADLTEGQPVWIVEGEKKVEALRALGSIAVSGDAGAQSKWLPEHARLLRGCPVIFWPDSDAPGEQYIANAAAAIRAENFGTDLRVVRPFPMAAKAEKGLDVCDWTGSAKEFAALIESAKPYRGRYKATGSLIAKCASDIQPEPISWLWRDRIPHRRLSVLTGPPGLGKSQIAASITAHVTTGKPWPDGTPCSITGAVIILSAEDSPSDTIVPRLEAAGANRKRVHIAEAIRTATDDGQEAERMFDLSRDTAHLETLCRNTQAVALSHRRTEHATNLRLCRTQAAATASRHVCIADALKARCVLAEVRWRWTLKVL